MRRRGDGRSNRYTPPNAFMVFLPETTSHTHSEIVFYQLAGLLLATHVDIK